MLTTNKAVYGTDGSLTELGKLKGSGSGPLTPETVVTDSGVDLTLEEYIQGLIATTPATLKSWTMCFSGQNEYMNTVKKFPTDIQNAFKGLTEFKDIILMIRDNETGRGYTVTFADTFNHFKGDFKALTPGLIKIILYDMNNSENGIAPIFFTNAGVDSDGDYTYKITSLDTSLYSNKMLVYFLVR